MLNVDALNLVNVALPFCVFQLMGHNVHQRAYFFLHVLPFVSLHDKQLGLQYKVFT